MAFYRYALETPNTYTRSLIQIGDQLQENKYFTYRLYTSQRDILDDFRVVTLGYEKSYPGKTLKPRSLNRFCIRYVTRGSAVYCGELVKAGQFFFSLPEENYYFECNDSDFEFYYIAIYGNGMTELIKNAGFTYIPKICNCPFIHEIPKILRPPLFAPHTEKDTDFYLLSVFFHLISLHRPYNIASIDSESDATLNYYRDALNYVKEYLCNGITPNDVAEFLHLSPSYLRTIFRKHCEYSLQEYMIRKRIEMAADQLKHGNHSVKEAATAVGYDDPAQFCKMFKKHMGVSPKKYRELDP